MIGHAEVFCCERMAQVICAYIMADAEKSGEYFGLLDICGKGASFIGTMLISVVSQTTGNANLAIGVMVVVFVVGLTFFIKSVNVHGDSEEIRAQQPISGI